MISHIFIKNYRAFKKNTIVLGNHTLLIGTHNSGKTSVLSALDVFFNHTLERAHVRNKKHDVVIEINIDNIRYRKVFSPPNYTFNAHKAIGDFTKIKHLTYLFFPEKPNPYEHFINQCAQLTLPIKTHQVQINSPLFFENKHHYYEKTLSYINYRLKTPLKKATQKQQQVDLIDQLPLNHTIIGVDRLTNTFPHKAFQSVIEKTYQTVMISNQKQVINTFDHHIEPLYKSHIKEEIDTITETVSKNYRKTFILVEGKYDVPWFEKALNLLGKTTQYRVLPCGGHGNIQFVHNQLQKADFKTIIITDGDLPNQGYVLKRDVIEMYAELDILTHRFNANFKTIPDTKKAFFKAIPHRDDIVKEVLSSWARNHLHIDNPFVQELKDILSKQS